MFYENLKRLCAQRNETPSGVAKKIGLSNATASGWKKGKVPSEISLTKLSQYFGVPVSELLGGSGEKQKAPPESGGEKERYDKETSEAIAMYLQLDAGDRGEIRGVMREKLKGEKYSGKQKLLNA